MHVSRYYIQQLEKSIRQSRRKTASEVAKKAGAKETQKTPAVRLTRDRNTKSFEMPR